MRSDSTDSSTASQRHPGDVILHVLLHEVATHGDLTTTLSALGRAFDSHFIGYCLGRSARL